MVFDRWRSRLTARLASTFRSRRMEQEIEEELRFHIDETTRRGIDENGLAPEEAHLAALRRFGGVVQAKEQCREARRVPLLDWLLQDARYAARGLRRNPAFSIVAILTLALGIGANTAIFSVVYGVLVRPLPYEEPDRLVSIQGTYPKGAFVAMRNDVRLLRVAAYAEGYARNLLTRDAPIRVPATFVSAELFSVLGVRPQLGRVFEPGEDLPGHADVVILSDALWNRTFGRDPQVVGRLIQLDGVSHQIVGVLPADFHFPSSDMQLWLPFRADARVPSTYWAGDFMPVIGRLAAGASPEEAQREIRAFQTKAPALFPWAMPRDWNANVSVVPLQRGLVGDLRARLLLLFGAVAFVLLIACVNVANLTLSRTAMRRFEIGIRTTLGADRIRIAGQLFVESIVLALCGGVLGVGVAIAGLNLVTRWLPGGAVQVADAHIDWHVLVFAAVLICLAGVMSGLAPAWHITRRPVTGAMRSGRGSTRSAPAAVRHVLVAGETAVAVMLVIAAALLIRSLWKLATVDPGFHSDRVISASITPSSSFCHDTEACLGFYRRVMQDVQTLPGLDAAALINTPPLTGRVTKRSIQIDGATRPNAKLAPLVWLNTITPDYFRVMKIPVISGATFSPADSSGNAAVALVDLSTAKRYWNSENPIGRQLRFVGETDWRTIIGVVADVRAYSMEASVPGWLAGTIYVPYNTRATQEDGRLPAAMTLVAHTAADGVVTSDSLRRLIANISRDVPIEDVSTMRTAVARAVWVPASMASLFVSFGGVALLLGAIGVYGVLAFQVSTRTREIGIRMALGARQRDVLWPILREALTAVLLGILVGLGGALGASRWLAGQLYDLSPLDPLTYAGVALTMIVVTLAASVVPALRAVRVDPLIALRREH
jgi:putative ABC transport system permease protein